MTTATITSASHARALRLAIAVSVDDVVGARDQRRRGSQAERSRGLEIHDQLELDGLLHRHVRRLGSLDDAIHVPSRATEEGGKIGTVGEEPPRADQALS